MNNLDLDTSPRYTFIYREGERWLKSKLQKLPQKGRCLAGPWEGRSPLYGDKRGTCWAIKHSLRQGPLNRDLAQAFHQQCRSFECVGCCCWPPVSPVAIRYEKAPESVVIPHNPRCRIPDEQAHRASCTMPHHNLASVFLLHSHSTYFGSTDLLWGLALSHF